MFPFISIVVPTKNNAKHLENCLKSLTSLNYPKDRFEIIVSDGHSSDNTTSIAHNYDALVLEDNGCCRASGCNVGFENSRGDYVAFTDADCMVDRDWLTNAIKYLKDENIAGVGGPNLPPRTAPNLTKAVHFASLLSPLAISFDTTREVRSLAGCNCIYKKQLVAPFFPLFETKAAEDTLLNYNIIKAGLKLLSAPDVIVWHDRHYKTYGSLFKQMILYGEANAQINKRSPGIMMPLQRFEAYSVPFFLALCIIFGILSTTSLLLVLSLSIPIYFIIVSSKVYMVTKSLKVAWLAPQALFLCIAGFSIGYLTENFLSFSKY
jgi:glycosyltransferase involved in cell wall biosynthesis